MTSYETLEDQIRPGHYDAVLRIERFTDVYELNRGWKVAVNPTSRDALALCTAVRVAPIGAFDSGKTWLMKKLCGDSLAGLVNTQHTETFGIKISNLSNDVAKVCFLDTAGLNSPVTSVTALGRMLGYRCWWLPACYMDPMKAMQEMLRELKRQENFIRQVAFEFAQVYLLVVGQISHRDQLEILQLIELAEQYQGTKEIIVVHNLKTMTYDEVTKEIDVRTNLTYRECVAQGFSLTIRQVEVMEGGRTALIDELHGGFSDLQSGVHIRHVFLTKDTADDPACKNCFVVERIRHLIRSQIPTVGSVLRDIANIASKCAKNMVRPPSKTVAIRYHEERSMFLGGEVAPYEEYAANTLSRAADALTANVLQPLWNLEARIERLNTPEESQELQALESELARKRIEALAVIQTTEVDAATLVPLREAIIPYLVPLGATLAADGIEHVKFNVTRTRCMLNHTEPCWAVLVHMTVPALAPGELGRLKGELQWDRGVTMEGLTPRSPDTLKIRFKARVLPMPARQLAALNHCGRPALTPTLRDVHDVVAIDSNTPPAVIEAGTRPFPTAAATLGARWDAMREDGSITLDVVVHTKVENCVWEIPPVLHYSRGVLSLTVWAVPTDEELQAPVNESWVRGDLAWLDDPLPTPYEHEQHDLPDEAAPDYYF